ncbi:hypothetical protein CXF68_14870 [Tenacibaculum sp. Bg11-29]|uniref:hypothetical protein n=1 Tax=Tenacibaculum sp. Bg11-29 TaxID=2058306 RepID=UPI000C34667C|nr:hypothetical protein [Tenacibaculum sp. Bg11-29]PKH51889.1 hypothetical protein CXF68_14870 [Tenacibaculum sp. Bg11-29]
MDAKIRKTNKKELYESLTSMNSLAYSIISYGIFYGIKQAAFFFKLFAYLITNELLRIVPSLFFGYFISRAMLNTSVHVAEKKEWVIISISCFDFLVLCVITDVLNQNNWVDITNLLIFCAFVTYLGFWLNNVFVNRVKEKRKEAIQEQKIADSKHRLADVAQKIEVSNTTLASISTSITEEKQYLENLKQEIRERSCPYCLAPFPSKKARDGHKGRCSDKPTTLN